MQLSEGGDLEEPAKVEKGRGDLGRCRRVEGHTQETVQRRTWGLGNWEGDGIHLIARSAPGEGRGLG